MTIKRSAIVLSAITLALSGCLPPPGSVTSPTPQNGDAALRNSMVELLTRQDALERQLRDLRNQVEIQGHELETMQTQQSNLMQGLNQRLQTQGGAAPAGGATVTIPAGTAAAPSVPANVTQQQAYDAAFSLLKQGLYSQATQAFKSFMAQYPNSTLAGNAQYWIAEIDYVGLDFNLALSEFNKVVNDYPLSTKVPDALLKIGYCYFEMKQWDKARQALTNVVSRFPDTAVAASAKVRLDTMSKQGH